VFHLMSEINALRISNNYTTFWTIKSWVKFRTKHYVN
jgi:hypothetical protein